MTTAPTASEPQRREARVSSWCRVTGAYEGRGAQVEENGRKVFVGVAEGIRPLLPNDRVLVEWRLSGSLVVYVDDTNSFINGAGI
jgi:hypothetical protein